MTKKILSAILALALVFTFTVSVSAVSVDTASSVAVSAEQSAVLTFSNSSIAETSAGSGYEMTLIAAVVIGGTSFSGGKVSVLGTFLGVLLLSMIESGMVISKVPVYWQEMVKGAVIILAIVSAAVEKLPGAALKGPRG